MTDIGAGSIVGMGSLVMGKFPTNVVLAGNPAIIVRRYVAWDREANEFVENKDFFKPYCFSFCFFFFFLKEKEEEKEITTN